MFKVIILAITCFAIVNGNLKDDIKDKASEALHQGEKVKVCLKLLLFDLLFDFIFQ
jgi:hypothetical protein